MSEKPPKIRQIKPEYKNVPDNLNLKIFEIIIISIQIITTVRKIFLTYFIVFIKNFFTLHTSSQKYTGFPVQISVS